MYKNGVKRIFDFLISAVVMIVFCWLYLILAIVVRINLGGPIIFRQDRPGRIDPKTGQETIFKLYKFRSMSNATDEEGNLLPDKDRLTKFGRFLRASSLDELPEFWNILKGDMSLVGPRPWAVSYFKYFTPEEHRRHEVRPGLTGLAQVNGRTAADWGQRIKYDLEYVDHVSVGMDIGIIFKTVKKVFGKSDIVEAGCQGNFDDYRKKQWADGVVPKPEWADTELSNSWGVSQSAER